MPQFGLRPDLDGAANPFSPIWLEGGISQNTYTPHTLIWVEGQRNTILTLSPRSGRLVSEPCWSTHAVYPDLGSSFGNSALAPRHLPRSGQWSSRPLQPDLVITTAPVWNISKSHGSSYRLLVKTYSNHVCRLIGSWAHRFIGSSVQEYIGSWVHRFMGSRVHRFMGSSVHRFAFLNRLQMAWV